MLTIDTNQTSLKSHNASGPKPHSIEWLHMEHGMDDPFEKIHGDRPSSTTLTPNRDIDYILTYGVLPQNITLLPIDTPAQSDHRGICLDIDAKELFNSTYSELSCMPGCKLALNNVQAKKRYITYKIKQLKDHKIWERTTR